AAPATDLLLAYGTRLALTGATFEIPTGVTVALIRPNGAGKSSLLRALARLLEPRAGALDVPARRRRGGAARVLRPAGADRPPPASRPGPAPSPGRPAAAGARRRSSSRRPRSTARCRSPCARP